MGRRTEPSVRRVVRRVWRSWVSRVLRGMAGAWAVIDEVMRIDGLRRFGEVRRADGGRCLCVVGRLVCDGSWVMMRAES